MNDSYLDYECKVEVKECFCNSLKHPIKLLDNFIAKFIYLSLDPLILEITATKIINHNLIDIGKTKAIFTFTIKNKKNELTIIEGAGLLKICISNLCKIASQEIKKKQEIELEIKLPSDEYILKLTDQSIREMKN